MESGRGSFEDTLEAIERSTGVSVGKRQVEELAAKAAADVEDFYATRTPAPVDHGDVLVISADGKGIVMRPDSLRPPTAAKAQAATTKLETRLSKGEKRNRKRLAEVGAVYDLTPSPRTATDVMTRSDGQHDPPPPPPPPQTKNKWLTASVVEDAAEVLATIFDEAERRDPTHARPWVALVDGNNHQIERIETEAATRGVSITVVVDFIHVLEYLWDAAWCFYPEGDPQAEDWVHDRALAILEGNAKVVAAGLRRRATTTRLPAARRKKADEAARYLHNKAPYLDYPTALTAGWPIATGVIEGACRHLIKDRMDITGARWSVNGAETILKLRAVRSNGDFDQYWTFHLAKEHHRNHQHATPTPPSPTPHSHSRRAAPISFSPRLIALPSMGGYTSRPASQSTRNRFDVHPLIANGLQRPGGCASTINVWVTGRDESRRKWPWGGVTRFRRPRGVAARPATESGPGYVSRHVSSTAARPPRPVTRLVVRPAMHRAQEIVGALARIPEPAAAKESSCSYFSMAPLPPTPKVGRRSGDV